MSAVFVNTYLSTAHIRVHVRTDKMADLKDCCKVFVLLVTLLSVIDVSASDSSVCTPTTFRPGLQDPRKPDVSKYNIYEVKVEANIVNRNYTTDYTIYFDYANHRAAQEVIEGGAKTKRIFGFDTNEIFEIQTLIGGPVCKVSNISESPHLFLYGQKTGSGEATIFEAGVFHYASSHSEQWIKRANIRGVPCNLWRSCLNLPSSNATMIVDWYFSVPGWVTPRLNDQIPVRAHVSGVSFSSRGMQRSFEHVYDFVNFNNDVVDSNVFKTPEGVYCPGKKSTLPFPTLPTIFSFSSEIVDVNNQQINVLEEYYDLTQNVLRYEGFMGMLNAYQTQVMDFSTGRTFTIDQNRGNCSVTEIDLKTLSAKAIGNDTKHVRMKTPKEFFYVDTGDFIYEGTRMVRDILCHVWIGRKTDWPEGMANGSPSIWEWYFATSNYTGDEPNKLRPVKLELNAPGFGFHVIYNIYDYKERKTIFWDLDLDLCLNATDKRDFTFMLTEQYSSSGTIDLDALKYAIHTAIKKESGILSSLRIHNIKVDIVTKTNLKVSFTLLDRSTPLGNVVNQHAEPDLKTAGNALARSISDGYFTLTMTTGKGNKQIVMVAKPGSLTVTNGV